MGLSLLRCVDLTSDLFQAFLQRMGAISTMAKLGLLRTVLSTAAFLCVFQLSSSLFLAVMASAITAALVVVAVEVPVVRHWSQGIASAYPLLQHWIRLKPRFDAATLQRLFKRVIPLGGTALLGSLFVQLPLYIIGHKMGKGDVGYFAVVYNPSIVIQVFMVGVLEGLLSRLSNAAATGDAPLLRHLMGRAIFAALAM
jgi:O-antigen/teichoic acid export membrane protein